MIYIFLLPPLAFDAAGIYMEAASSRAMPARHVAPAMAAVGKGTFLSWRDDHVGKPAQEKGRTLHTTDDVRQTLSSDATIAACLDIYPRTPE